MRQVSKVGKVLLQVAAIGFFVNAMGAYGACDMTMHSADVSAEERMPCHGVAGGTTTQDTSEIEAEDCCSACVPVAIFASLGVATQLAADAVDSQSILVLVSSGFDPPFRPPIAILS